MGLTFLDTTVTIDGTPYQTFDPDARHTQPCAWSPAVITWGYADTTDKPEPSVLTLNLTVPTGQPLPAYGALVRVATRPATSGGSWAAEPVFRGHVDGLAQSPGGQLLDGTRVSLHASGDFARLGRHPLADRPWPEEPAQDRMTRIAELLGDRVDLETLTAQTGTYDVRARDVDSINALDVITRTIAPQAGLLVETDAGPQLRPLPLPARLLREAAGGPAWIERATATDPAGSVLVSARGIEDGPLTLDVASLVNVAAVTYPVMGESGQYADTTTSWTNTDSVDTYGASQWRTETDALNAPATPIAQRASALTRSRGTPRWRTPDPAVIVLDAYNDNPTVLLPAAAGALIVLTDTRPGIEANHRVIGGTLTLHGDPDQQAVEVRLEPAEAAAGGDMLTLAELANFPINTLTAVTIADLASVSDALVI